MEYHRGVLEANDDPPGPEGNAMKLQHILVEQLEARAGRRGVVELGDRDGRAGDSSGGSFVLHVLRNSDRRAWGTACSFNRTSFEVVMAPAVPIRRRRAGRISSAADTT
jgi:hypothetical protein